MALKLGTLLNVFRRQRRVDLARFKIECQTGRGSMSKVFRAMDTQYNRLVALKIFDAAKLARLDARYSRVRRPPEWEIAVALRHPNVVHTYEYGTSTDGQQFMVMEFIHGTGLNYVVETEKSRLVGHRVPVLLGAARGLAYMHQAGYVHRDICCRNIMVDNDYNAKLIDFGLTVPNRPEFQGPGIRTGTAAYMAPELIRRERTDHRVDIFAFGVVMYEIMTEHLPWEGAGTLKVVVQHMNTDARPASELNPAIEPELDRIIAKALARDRNERYQSMNDLVADLEKLRKTDY